MTDRGISRLLDYLRRQAPPGADLVPDGVLLGKYADARDEPAFELLVRRHGPLVWSAVRRILRDEHACEDALQATFLALARKAGSLRGSTSVAGWLYRVAVRVALRARPKARPMLPMPETDGDPAIALERSELIAVVDEEVNRLPERLRAAVVLCCFNGHSTEEAAQRLGCPRGTILSRLSAAREKLRQQLARRGFEAASVGPLLAECGPAPLTSSLIAIALRAAGPAAALSPFAITLAQGALTAMLMTKVKITAIVLVAAAGLSVGATHWAGAVASDPPTAKDKPVAAKAQDARPETIDRDPRLSEVEARVASLMRLAEIERQQKVTGLRDERDRLAKAEEHFWQVMAKEQETRERLLDQLSGMDDSRIKLMLDAIDAASKKHLEKLYEIKPSKDVGERLGMYKKGHFDGELEIIQASLATLNREREDLRVSARGMTTERQRIENQIKRSELREALELEKYRKLLK